MTTPRVKKVILLTFAGLSITAIIWINYQIIGSWFFQNGPANLGSIEVSYVSMGRFLADFGLPILHGPSWIPFWYLGFPFDVFYTPLLPFLESLLKYFFSIPLWEGYRLLTGLSFILGPVAVFFLGWQLSKRIIGGVVAALLYSVGPTIFYFILPSGEVLADRFSVDFFDPRRFTILVRWGEGPHLFSLIFLPLAGVFFARVLEKNHFKDLILTAFFLGLTALSNAIGLFAGILLLFSFAFVKFAQSSVNRAQSWRLFLVVGTVALGLISFWYNLTFLGTFFREGAQSGGVLKSLLPWGIVAIVALLSTLYLIIQKFIKDFAIASSLLWFGVLFSIVATYYLSAPPDESFLRIQLLPQALRYNAEVDLSLALLIGVIVGRIVGKKSIVLEYLSLGMVIVLLILSTWYIQPFLETASKAAGVALDVKKTREYEVSSWLLSHVDLAKGERVVVPGNYGFYLNYFGNIWQLRGGLFQASTNFWPDHIYYQLANGTDSQIAKAWLLAINAKYLVIAAPGSAEIYKDFKNLGRFEGLPIAYQEKGDLIYEVPKMRASLAKPVNLVALRSLKPPKKADDKQALLTYTDWVEHSSQNQTNFTMIDNQTYKISGKIKEAEGILVQMTHSSGWRAKDENKGKGVKIGQDPLGFLMLYPDPPAGGGEVNIVLRHGVTLEQVLGYVITFATVLAILRYGLLKGKLYGRRNSS